MSYEFSISIMYLGNYIGGGGKKIMARSLSFKDGLTVELLRVNR